tara:strand:- start:565 stop:1518 length:954 start_codon:yes stop_codon:yes gene_type:complete
MILMVIVAFIIVWLLITMIMGSSSDMDHVKAVGGKHKGTKLVENNEDDCDNNIINLENVEKCGNCNMKWDHSNRETYCIPIFLKEMYDASTGEKPPFDEVVTQLEEVLFKNKNVDIPQKCLRSSYENGGYENIPKYLGCPDLQIDDDDDDDEKCDKFGKTVGWDKEEKYCGIGKAKDLYDSYNMFKTDGELDTSNIQQLNTYLNDLDIVNPINDDDMNNPNFQNLNKRILIKLYKARKEKDKFNNSILKDHFRSGDYSDIYCKTSCEGVSYESLSCGPYGFDGDDEDRDGSIRLDGGYINFKKAFLQNNCDKKKVNY